MKKIVSILSLILLGTTTYAQMGVNTQNPQGTFHVDGAKDNPSTGTPSAAQQANDIIVTATGNVGIGTTAPSTKLHVDNTTAGAIRITDGSQGAGKILTSDANGVASWSTPATSLYFVSASPYVTGQSDYQGTVNPVTGTSTNERFITNGVVTNLGPTTTITQGTQGISYRIPVTGLYRMTLYIDAGYAGSAVAMRAYRNGSLIRSNADSGPTGLALTMINIWPLQAGDVIVPMSIGSPVPSGTQLVETTFTVERVN